MKIGIVIYSADSETVWNAFRFGNFGLNQKDEVTIFLLAKGVEIENIDTEKFRISEQIKSFAGNGGQNICLWILPENSSL